MVHSLSRLSKACEICGDKTFHALCHDCRRSVDTTVKPYLDSRVYGPIHPSWLQPRTKRT